MMVKTKIPGGWDEYVLSDVGDLIMGQSPAGRSYNEKGIGLPLLNGAADLTENGVKINQYTSQPTRIAGKGTLIFCIRATIGNINEANDNYCIGRGVSSLKVHELHFSKKYIYYLIDSKFEEIKRLSAGSVIRGIKKDELKSMALIIPKAITEQQRISKILSTIDDAINTTEELIEKNKRIKQGLMQDFFKDIINNKIEVIPFEKCIEKIIDFRGKTPKKINMEWNGGDIPALSANNVEMGRINFQKETYYGSNKLYQRWMNKGNLEIGDIIMTMEAPLGNVLQIPDDKKYILSQRVIALRPKPNIDKTYFSYYLMSDSFQKQLFLNSTGTTALGIQQARLIKISVYLHKDKNEQIRIASILSSMDNKIQSEENYLKKLVQMKAGLMQVLLTGDRRVKLEAS